MLILVLVLYLFVQVSESNGIAFAAIHCSVGGDSAIAVMTAHLQRVWSFVSLRSRFDWLAFVRGERCLAA